MITIGRTTRVSDEVILQIQQMLYEGKLKKGDRLLSEREMAKTLGISRPALREALSALESMGIVERRKGGGAYVRKLHSDDVISAFIATKTDKAEFEDLLEIREVLESKAVEWVIERATVQDLEKIHHAIVLLTRSGDRSGIDEDILFHLYIAAATHNVVLYKLTERIGNLLSEVREKTLRLPGRKEECIQEHQNIYEAIRAKEKAKAVVAMKYHIRKVESLTNRI